MKNRSNIMLAILGIVLLSSCGFNRVQPNYEGVLMSNYGRSGKDDFKLVTGTQGILGPGSEIYQVPMFEQKADPKSVKITAKDAGVFTVDPTYTYNATRGKGIDIVFAYKHVGLGSEMMDNIEESILNPIVLNAYREAARTFTTDSLMNNLNAFEQAVESRLEKQFKLKGFDMGQLTSGLTPPQSMRDAIENRNNAVQQAEQVRNELQVSEMNLKKARIDAEANRARATGLSDAVLREKWIEAIRNTKNKVIITDGKTPIIVQ